MPRDDKSKYDDEFTLLVPGFVARTANNSDYIFKSNGGESVVAYSWRGNLESGDERIELKSLDKSDGKWLLLVGIDSGNKNGSLLERVGSRLNESDRENLLSVTIDRRSGGITITSMHPSERFISIDLGRPDRAGELRAVVQPLGRMNVNLRLVRPSPPEGKARGGDFEFQVQGNVRDSKLRLFEPATCEQVLKASMVLGVYSQKDTLSDTKLLNGFREESARSFLVDFKRLNEEPGWAFSVTAIHVVSCMAGGSSEDPPDCYSYEHQDRSWRELKASILVQGCGVVGLSIRCSVSALGDEQLKLLAKKAFKDASDIVSGMQGNHVADLVRAKVVDSFSDQLFGVWVVIRLFLFCERALRHLNTAEDLGKVYSESAVSVGGPLLHQLSKSVFRDLPQFTIDLDVHIGEEVAFSIKRLEVVPEGEWGEHAGELVTKAGAALDRIAQNNLGRVSSALAELQDLLRGSEKYADPPFPNPGDREKKIVESDRSRILGGKQ